MERKKPPVSLEDRGLIESGVSTRHDMRSRPPVPPVGDSAAIAIRMFRALVVCLDIASLQWMNTPLKNESPGRKRPPGASRFSTLFNVAAIGGKSPRLRLSVESIALSAGCQAGVRPTAESPGPPQVSCDADHLEIRAPLTQAGGATDSARVATATTGCNDG